jgi:cyclic pyranopterin phosphate synthase
MAMLADRFGRSFPYLRLSLLEACNFRCGYCLPDGHHAASGQPPLLSLGEIARLLRAFVALGMRKLRLTGGEPTLRKDLVDIIALAASVPGIDKIAMTTNGVLLRKHVRDWRAAGLTALNVSVDSLDRARFAAITGHDRLDDILAGVEDALALGFDAVKLNAVLLRGLNDGQLPEWLDYLRERDIAVRFIELMQTGDNREYFERHHVRAEALQAQLESAGWSAQPRASDAGPAIEYAHPGHAGRIGVIAPYARDFCAGCNRLRVTAKGDLRLCLFGEIGIPLRPLLQEDAQHELLCATISRQLGIKRETHLLHQGETGLVPHLASIGG